MIGISEMCGNIKSEKGSAVVEFAFYIFVFMLMCGILMDMTFSLIKKSEIERVNNSLMSVLRERNAFYDGRSIPSDMDFWQIKDVADTLLTKNGTIEPYQLQLRIATPMMDKDTTASKRPTFSSSVFDSQNITGCEFGGNSPSIEQLGKLSVFGHPPSSADPNGIWYPVYELTICVPGAVSHFQQMLGLVNKKLGSLYIRNVAIPRI